MEFLRKTSDIPSQNIPNNNNILVIGCTSQIHGLNLHSKQSNIAEFVYDLFEDVVTVANPSVVQRRHIVDYLVNSTQLKFGTFIFGSIEMFVCISSGERLQIDYF